MSTRILTDEQVDQAAADRARGLSVRQIQIGFRARGIDISLGSIEWQLLRVGADLPPQKRQRSNGFCGRGRPFTDAEDRQLLDLERAGLGYTAIGRRMGRPHNSVLARLRILARHAARREEQAA